MPRQSRKKEDGATYHVIVRSISEIDAFKRTEDKKRYLAQMKYYKEIYKFKVYAYCVMSNHAHFVIEPNGADISKIMHGLNLKYAACYNKIYNRHGHLFQDRFKSKIVNTSSYFTTLIGYIHNNPSKIKGYKKCPEKYKYSSLGVYLGLVRDKTGLLDEKEIHKMFDIDKEITRENYLKFIYMCDNNKLEEQMELQNEKSEYRDEKAIMVRNYKLEEILDFISKETGVEKIMLFIKNNRISKEARALVILFMRGLCDYKIKDICKIIGNVTQSTVSRMCIFAVELITNKEEYRYIVDRFIKQQGVQLVI